MKIVLATAPAPGHVNPMLGIARILLAEGNDVVALAGGAFKDRIEGIGAGFFHPIAASADQDLVDPFSKSPELKTLPPVLELLRVVIERSFINTNRAADVVIGDDCFLGLLPMFLGPRFEAPTTGRSHRL
jgi:UDP:flavonoid glycosyltransferase YjiC (YdhE family)